VFWNEIFDKGIIFLQENRGAIILKAIWAFAIFVILQIINKRIVNKVKWKIRNNSLNYDKYTEKTVNLIWNIIHITILSITILIIFAFLGLEVSLVLWWFSIAIGFAMETTIKNMIAWIFILTNKKMKIWEFIEILSPFHIRGTIEEVTLRHTIIRLIDKTRIIIPNGELSDSAIKTLKSEKMIRANFDIHVPRHTNLEQVKSLIISAINESENVINKNYTSNIIAGFDKNWFKIRSFFYYNPQLWKSSFVLSSDFRLRLSKIFKKYGIKAPYEVEIFNIE